MTTKNGRGNEVERERGELPGIVIAEGRRIEDDRDPRISAFIWGGKVRPTPALPYGRRKGAA